MSTEMSLILAIVCSAAMAIALKMFPIRQGNRYGIILGNYLTCVVTAFLMIPDRSMIARIDTKTLVCGMIAGFLFVIALVTMQSSIRYCGAILTAAFSKLGLIVPLILSIFFWKEIPGAVQIIGLILVFAAVWLIREKEEDRPDPSGGSRSKMFWLIAVLVFFGTADAMAKVFEQIGEREKDGVYFLILFITAAILAVLLLIREQKKTGAKIVPSEVAAGIIVGIPNYFSSALLLRALAGLPAIVVYPCFSVGTILLVTLISAAAFKERIGRRKWIGLAFILAALILLNLPGGTA